MIRYLRDRLIDGAVALGLVMLIFEGPTALAVIKHKIKRAA